MTAHLEPDTDWTLCIRCHDEPAQPDKPICLRCEEAETDNIKLALQAKELARQTVEKYGPAVGQVKDLGAGM